MGGGVNLIQAMPEFWEHLDRSPLPKIMLTLAGEVWRKRDLRESDGKQNMMVKCKINLN